MPSTDVQDPVVLVEQVLRRSRLEVLRRIRVGVHTSRTNAIVLRGRVDSYYHKQLAQELSRMAAGREIEIINELSVEYSGSTSGNAQRDSRTEKKTTRRKGARRKESSSIVDLPARPKDRAESQGQLARSYDAFLRNLPQLMAEHCYEWVAFSGDTQIAIGPSKRQLYRHCLDAGYVSGNFLICSIEPPQQIVLDELPDV